MVIQEADVDNRPSSPCVVDEQVVFHCNVLQGVFSCKSIHYSEWNEEGGVDVEGGACVHQVEVKETVPEDELAEALNMEEGATIDLLEFPHHAVVVAELYVGNIDEAEGV
jgi:hypothetical protein